MATIKVKLRQSSVVGKVGTIYYQVTHRRVSRQITTNIRLLPEHWDNDRECIPPSDFEADLYQSRINGEVSMLRAIIGSLDKTGMPYTAEDIVRMFHSSEKSVSIFVFIKKQIESLRLDNRLGTAKNYEHALACFTRFLGGDIPIFAITELLIEQFNAYLVSRGVVRNTISFYMRTLRAVYNKAVRKGLVEQTFPFKNVYTGIDRTRKQAVEESIIARFAGLDLSFSASLSLTRDLFLFSFYTRGMSFVDMAYLKCGNVRNGMIRYIRRKTRQELVIRMEPDMQVIIERYVDKKRPYIFPIIRNDDPEEAYKEYRRASTYCNRLLKRLCHLAGVQQRLSFYTARHSWATAARNHRVPVSVISAGMGHTSERTTQIYLAMMENSLIDDANKEILEALRCARTTASFFI